MRQCGGHAACGWTRAGVAHRSDRDDSGQPERAFCWPAAARAGRTPGLSSHTVVTPTRARDTTATEGWGMIATPVPPGPRAHFPGAPLLAFARDRLGFVCRLKHDYGDVVAFRLGPERTVLLSHPDHLYEVLVRQHRAFQKGRRGDVTKQFLGEGLLNSEGARHQRQRRLLQPAFHRQRLAQYATVMTTYAARLRQAWQDGDTLDITPAMMRVTLAIAAKTLLDADVEAEATAIGQAITTLLQRSPRVPLPLAPLLRRLPLPSQRRLRRARDYLDTLIYRLIDERRATGGATGDVLAMLVGAQTEDGSPLSPQLIHDEALTLLLAGHETT